MTIAAYTLAVILVLPAVLGLCFLTFALGYGIAALIDRIKRPFWHR